MRTTIPAGNTERAPLRVDPHADTERYQPEDGWVTWEQYTRALGLDPRLARLSDLTKWIDNV